MRSAVVVVVSALLMVVAAEIATRWIDGYQLFPPLLLRISPPPTIDENLVTDYVNRLTVPADVDRRWFADDPDESSGGSTSPDPELVAYAARDGATALDGRNSPFTTALLHNIETPGVEITFMFRNVRDDVMEATRNEQQPFVYGSLPGREDFYFRP